MSTPVEHLTPARLRDWALPEPSGAKRSRGQALIVGGARTCPGAAMLAGLAALRVGAGVLSLAVAESVAVAVAVAIPEAGVTGLPETPGGSVRGAAARTLDGRLQGSDAVLIGPGLDDADEAASLMEGLISLVPTRVPVVLDAFALGALAAAPDTAAALRGRLVLTPNPAEAALLLGVDEEDLGDSQEAALSIATTYGAVVSFRGMIASPGGEVWAASAGHAGLGTSGSGDVLAGALTGLLARGATAEQAACWATYLHAAAGDRLAARIGRLGFLAREVLEELPRVLAELT
jgi:ADP-dependent NAD(P)H-hydrate dehydratase